MPPSASAMACCQKEEEEWWEYYASIGIVRDHRHGLSTPWIREKLEEKMKDQVDLVAAKRVVLALCAQTHMAMHWRSCCDPTDMHSRD